MTDTTETWNVEAIRRSKIESASNACGTLAGELAAVEIELSRLLETHPLSPSAIISIQKLDFVMQALTDMEGLLHVLSSPSLDSTAMQNATNGMKVEAVRRWLDGETASYSHKNDAVEHSLTLFET